MVADTADLAMPEPPINIHVHAALSARQRKQLERAFQKGDSVMTLKSAPAKPGYQTTEFWVTVLTAVGATAASATNNLPPRYAAFASTISVVAYAISRGLAKH